MDIINCVEWEKKRPDAREQNLLELCVIPLADEEFVCWENTKHPNCQNNKKYYHSRLRFFIIYLRNHYRFLNDWRINVFLYSYCKDTNYLIKQMVISKDFNFVQNFYNNCVPN